MKTMNNIDTIIFDLSEVFIAGLIGFEPPMAALLNCTEQEIYTNFGGEPLKRLFQGEASEDDYLNASLARGGWDAPLDSIKQIIRANFHSVVPGTEALLDRLRQTGRYHTVLLSDHAVEWVDYITGVHPVLNKFDEHIFSYDIRHTKRAPETYPLVLERIARSAGQCFFVDDLQHNIENALAAGIAAKQFTGADALERDLYALGLLQRE